MNNTNKWVNTIEEAISREYYRLYEQKHFSNIRKVGTGGFGKVYRATCAVSCLHNEGIVHRDLHSGNVLVHRNIIKISDFGLSKRIESSSNTQSKLFGIIPYVDPKKFNGQRENQTSTQVFSLNEKSDIYSVGVLFWEISSGQPPFYYKNEQYDIDLALEISQGLREEPVPDTPKDYVEIYTECWNGEPDKRPTINQVVERLKTIMTKTNTLMENHQTLLTSTEELNFNPTNIDILSNIDISLHGEMSQIIQNFDKMNTREIVPTSLTNENEKNLNKIVNNTINYIFKIINEGKKSTIDKNNKDILDYFDNNINSQEIYYLLLTNQNNLDSIFLLGYFNYLGIETIEDDKKAFDLFINASGKGHILAQFYVGLCYETGRGTVKDEKLAFISYEKIANMGYASGLSKIGYFYRKGFGTIVDKQKAVEFYQQAANLGNGDAQNNLGNMYYKGKGVYKDYNKAFELYHKAANLGNSNAQNNLGNMYYIGASVEKNYDKAFELYYKAANAGDKYAQHNLALMYEYGRGNEKDINQAIYWYEKSAKQKFTYAQIKLKKLRKLIFLFECN
ncbi:HCP-like protein [Rhizophagus irregularis]|uniref:HCP-like protein n=1 Tax=Rhizophagus irregularis TaxID=588596 RepID=A0A2N1M9V2_9GLOM|nr:HCP-like protein [Rhizophagus irregularis]